jgi:hypothetical protein
MDKDSFEQWKSEQYDSQARRFDYVCEHRLKEIHKLLCNEYPPYPPLIWYHLHASYMCYRCEP